MSQQLENETTKVECNYCGVQISNKVGRIRSHMSKCSKKAKVSQPVHATSGAAALVAVDSDNDESQASSEQASSGIKSFFTKTTNKEKEKIDIQVARFFFANNISFNG